MTSEPDVKGMPSAPAQASTAELTQTQKVEEDLPSTDQQAAPSSPAGSEQQVGHLCAHTPLTGSLDSTPYYSYLLQCAIVYVAMCQCFC